MFSSLAPGVSLLRSELHLHAVTHSAQSVRSVVHTVQTGHISKILVQLLLPSLGSFLLLYSTSQKNYITQILNHMFYGQTDSTTFPELRHHVGLSTGWEIPIPNPTRSVNRVPVPNPTRAITLQS